MFWCRQKLNFKSVIFFQQHTRVSGAAQIQIFINIYTCIFNNVKAVLQECRVLTIMQGSIIQNPKKRAHFQCVNTSVLFRCHFNCTHTHTRTLVRQSTCLLQKLVIDAARVHIISIYAHKKVTHTKDICNSIFPRVLTKKTGQ